MRQLSEEEKNYYNDLEQNFDKHVEKYRNLKEQELQQGKKAELEAELYRLDEYYSGCMRGEISELRLNIDFCYAKVNVLKELLGIEATKDRKK